MKGGGKEIKGGIEQEKDEEGSKEEDDRAMEGKREAVFKVGGAEELQTSEGEIKEEAKDEGDEGRAEAGGARKEREEREGGIL